MNRISRLEILKLKNICELKIAFSSFQHYTLLFIIVHIVDILTPMSTNVVQLEFQIPSSHLRSAHSVNHMSLDKCIPWTFHDNFHESLIAIWFVVCLNVTPVASPFIQQECIIHYLYNRTVMINQYLWQFYNSLTRINNYRNIAASVAI